MKRKISEHNGLPPAKKACIKGVCEKQVNPISLYKKAKAKLRNDSMGLIGRDKERQQISEFWEKCITSKKGGSMYISGAPGCGKTALLRELHAHFQSYEQENNMNPSIVLYINCMQLQTPESLFKHLCDALHLPSMTKGKKNSPEQTLRLYLSQPASKKVSSTRNKARKRQREGNVPPRGMIVLVADEIDRLRTSDNHVLYSLFELSALPNSPLVLLTIANALDMTDRILPRLLNSHCEPETLHFVPYSASQIASIIQKRLGDLVESVVEEDAIDFCAAKVSAQSADVRGALEIMRSAVQYVQDQYEDEVEECNEKIPLKKVSIIAVNRACRPVTPVIKVIQGLPQQQKFLLCALTRLALEGNTKPSIPQLVQSCSQIPFAKTMRKPDILGMIAQLRENGLIVQKSISLLVDEEDICFALEDTPLSKYLQIND